MVGALMIPDGLEFRKLFVDINTTTRFVHMFEVPARNAGVCDTAELLAAWFGRKRHYRDAVRRRFTQISSAMS